MSLWHHSVEAPLSAEEAYLAWQSSWLECRPVTAEVVSSNLIQVAIWIAIVIQCADVAQLVEQLICNQ